MELRKISVGTRTELGSRATNRLRQQGMIPGVIYAAGRDALSLSINSHDYMIATKGAAQTQLYELESEDDKLNGMMALVKDVQIDPLKDETLHVDFLELTRGEKVQVTIGLRVIGECLAVKQNTAVLNQSIYEVDIECLPRQIPDCLEIDISKLEEGQGVHSGNIELPEGVSLRSDSGLSVLSIVSLKEDSSSSGDEETESGSAEAE